MESIDEAIEKSEKFLREAARKDPDPGEFGVSMYGIAYDNIDRNPEYWDLSREEKKEFMWCVNNTLPPKAWLIWNEENGTDLSPQEEAIAKRIANKSIDIETMVGKGTMPDSGPFAAYEQDREFVLDVRDLAYQGLGWEEAKEQNKAEFRKTLKKELQKTYDWIEAQTNWSPDADEVKLRIVKTIYNVVIRDHVDLDSIRSEAKQRIETACNSLNEPTEGYFQHSDKLAELCPDKNTKSAVSNFSYSSIGMKSVSELIPAKSVCLGRELLEIAKTDELVHKALVDIENVMEKYGRESLPCRQLTPLYERFKELE